MSTDAAAAVDVSDESVLELRHILDLPDEILQLILGRCDAATVLACEVTARQLTARDDTWKMLCERDESAFMAVAPTSR